MATENQAAKAFEKSEDKAVEAGKARVEADKAEQDAFALRNRAANETVEKARKDKVETNDDGLIIGVDGKNPVSNVNPDPRTLRYAH